MLDHSIISEPPSPAPTTSTTDTTTLVARIMAEGPLGMSAVARRLGTYRDGKATHPKTPLNWATKGFRLPDGTILKLESVRLNGRVVTSWPAVLRFVEAQQGDTSGPASATQPRSGCQAEVAHVD